MNTIEIHQTHNRLFEGLSAEDIRQAMRYFRTREYRAGQYIFNTRQPAHCLFLVQKGLVHIGYITPDGDHRILDISEEGDIFGEMFLGEYPFRVGEAQAITDVCVYLLLEDDFYTLIQANPQIAINFIRHLGDSKRRLISRLHALQRPDARARLLGTLLSLARKMCCKNGSYFVLNQSISQQDLADMTGLNRSTVSSLINSLRKDGTLGGSGRYLTIDVPHVETILKNEGFELVE